jgi:hypothetical protein
MDADDFISSNDHHHAGEPLYSPGSESSYPPPAPRAEDATDLAAEPRIEVVVPTDPPTLSPAAVQALLRVLVAAAQKEGLR